MRRRSGAHPRRAGLVLVLASAFVAAFSAIAVSGAAAADFDIDNGPCRETPGEALLLRCPTANVGVPYEVQLESEEGSGCEPYVWYEIVNSALPGGLSMSRSGLISGIPTGGPGLTRFWVWNHDLTEAQGGPSWCKFEDRSEHEFSIPVDPGLAIVDPSVKGGTVGQAYAVTLTAREVFGLNPTTGPSVQATWSLASGALPPGIALSTTGSLAGTPSSEGSYQFVVRAQNGAQSDTEAYTLAVRQPVVVRSPFAPTKRPGAEVGVRFAASATATGGSGSYTWSLASGTLPSGLTLDPATGSISGRPQAAGTFSFALAATDAEARTATVDGAVTVAPRLAIATRRLGPARRARRYRSKLEATGGVRPVTWRIASGTLPLGVRLTRATGVLAGTPRRAGTFAVVVVSRDALGVTARQRLVLRVTG